MQRQSLPTSRPMPSHSPSNSHCGTKIPYPSPLFSFPTTPISLLSLTLYSMEYSLFLLRSPVVVLSTTNFLPIQVCLLGAGGGRVKKTGSFDTVQVLCNNSQNNCELSTLVLSQNPNCSTTLATINELQINLTSSSISARPGTR